MQNSAADTPTFYYLTITGDISIEPVPVNERVPHRSFRYLIMGPTGAGKSTLIEALSGEAQNLQISKDQLDGYTQRVTAYQLVNVRVGDDPIYLVDTPGFSDTKISETEIMDMVQDWIQENGLPFFSQILFLTPITEPRLGGTKRRTIEMLKAFLEPSYHLDALAFITTMWNQLHSERTERRAELNFAQLRDEILKEFIDEGANIKKFTDTMDSALQVLDNYSLSVNFVTGAMLRGPMYLYKDLHERIESALQQKKTLESDLASPEVHTSVALKSILEKNHGENEETLAKFSGQFLRFGELPVTHKEAYERLWHVLDPCLRIRLFERQEGPSHFSDDPLDDLYFDLMEHLCTDSPTRVLTR